MTGPAVLASPVDAGRWNYRQLLSAHNRVGLVGRRVNLSDNAEAVSFMKTLKLEGVDPMVSEKFADVVEHLPLHR